MGVAQNKARISLRADMAAYHAQFEVKVLARLKASRHCYIRRPGDALAVLCLEAGVFQSFLTLPQGQGLLRPVVTLMPCLANY